MIRTDTSTIWRDSQIEQTVVIASEVITTEANYEPLAENLALLRTMKDEQGRPLRVETLPMPEPVYFDGQRLPGKLRKLLHRKRDCAGANVQRSQTIAWH